ncbi:hypothetical protein RRG08_027663 [Elysia crispata]|uniref:Uncharacterized protein n=1 Tax=Elysia crispata TaxID=231223 RepID=A0AAE0XN77_9GAST|nr:hypothetical protein RRG08_027663 [Elysia crispata]
MTTFDCKFLKQKTEVRLPTGDNRDAGQTELKRKSSEFSQFSDGFANLNESINQLIPPIGCTPPTAADILKSKGNYPTREVDACKPVEYAATVPHEIRGEETNSKIELNFTTTSTPTMNIRY